MVRRSLAVGKYLNPSWEAPAAFEALVPGNASCYDVRYEVVIAAIWAEALQDFFHKNQESIRDAEEEISKRLRRGKRCFPQSRPD